MKGILFVFLNFMLWLPLVAQDTDSLPGTGEIRSAEVLIEKERKIVLPSANRLFRTTEIKELSKEPPPVDFSINAPKVSLPKYVPTFRIRSLEQGKKQETFSNEAYAGFGNYLSPMLRFTHLSERASWTVGASFFHESFIEGPVRNDKSGSSLTQIGLRATWHEGNTKFSFAPQYNRTGFFFYGLSDEAFANPSEQVITDRINTQDFQVNTSLSGKAINEKLNYRLDPKLSLVASSENVQNAFSEETNFIFDAGVDFSVDQSNRVGVDFRSYLGAYRSGATQSRQLVSLEPWYQTQVNIIDFRIGLQANAINDTSSQTQIGATMEIIVPLTDSWRIEGGIDNRLRFNRLLDLYPENTYLEDSLNLLTSIVKVPFYGKIHGTVLPNLDVFAGVEIQDIENALYFLPSQVDSSRFIVAYDSTELNVFKYQFGLNYLVDQSFEIKATFSAFDYTPGSEEEAWYRPSSILEFSAIKRFSKWIFSTQMEVVNGLVAPAPVDLEPVKLKGFTDLSFKVDYRLNDQSAVFLQGDNLFNRSYQYFLHYPTRRMAVKAGFRYRF